MESSLFFFVTTETRGQWKEQQLLPEWGLPRQGDRAQFSFEFYLERETNSHQAEKLFGHDPCGIHFRGFNTRFLVQT